MRASRLRLQRDGFADQLNCQIISARLMRHEAEHMMGLGMRGLGLEHLLVEHFRLSKIAPLVLTNRKVE